MTTIYLGCVIAAIVVAHFTLIPALLAAGVAAGMALRAELMWLGTMATSSIRAPRPKPVMVRRAPAEAEMRARAS